jgi:hypothetical protein
VAVPAALASSSVVGVTPVTVKVPVCRVPTAQSVAVRPNPAPTRAAPVAAGVLARTTGSTPLTGFANLASTRLRSSRGISSTMAVSTPLACPTSGRPMTAVADAGAGPAATLPSAAKHVLLVATYCAWTRTPLQPRPLTSILAANGYGPVSPGGSSSLMRSSTRVVGALVELRPSPTGVLPDGLTATVIGGPASVVMVAVTWSPVPMDLPSPWISNTAGTDRVSQPIGPVTLKQNGSGSPGLTCLVVQTFNTPMLLTGAVPQSASTMCPSPAMSRMCWVSQIAAAPG